MYPPIGEGFIFRGADGMPPNPDHWHKTHLVPLLQRAKLRLPASGLHSLRHSYVSQLIDSGEDIRYIADQVGHSSTQLTHDIYAHIFKTKRVEAMRRLNAVYPEAPRPVDATTD